MSVRALVDLGRRIGRLRAYRPGTIAIQVPGTALGYIDGEREASAFHRGEARSAPRLLVRGSLDDVVAATRSVGAAIRLVQLGRISVSGDIGYGLRLVEELSAGAGR